MMRYHMQTGLLAAALTASMALAASALAAPRDNDVAATPPPAMGHADADDSSRSMNSNGAMSTDRDTGLNRAQDRMSQQGLDHSRAQARNFGRDADDRNGTRDKDADKDIKARHVDRDGDHDRDASGDR